MRASPIVSRAPGNPGLRPIPEPSPEPISELGDLRFRALMRAEDWASLPPAIRRRFSTRLAGGRTMVYAGEVLESWMSRAGWWLAQAARLIGGPLPLTCDAHVPSVVTVTEGMGGQIWTRLYARRKGFPQILSWVPVCGCRSPPMSSWLLQFFYPS